MTRVTSFTNKRLSTNLVGVAKLPALPHLMLPQTRVRNFSNVTLETRHHRPTPITATDTASKRRPCANCRINKVKTKSGWRKLTRHKCLGCNVPLCIENKECFLAYHLKILLHKRHSPQDSEPNLCVSCLFNGNTVSTNHVCGPCRIPLCIDKECFKDFHVNLASEVERMSQS